MAHLAKIHVTQKAVDFLESCGFVQVEDCSPHFSKWCVGPEEPVAIYFPSGQEPQNAKELAIQSYYAGYKIGFNDGLAHVTEIVINHVKDILGRVKLL